VSDDTAEAAVATPSDGAHRVRARAGVAIEDDHAAVVRGEEHREAIAGARSFTRRIRTEGRDPLVGAVLRVDGDDLVFEPRCDSR
jgi:hypothetical protein